MKDTPISKIGSEPSEKVAAGIIAQVVSTFLVATMMWVFASNNINPPVEWVAGFTGLLNLIVSGIVMWFKRDVLRDYGKMLLQAQAARGAGVEMEHDADNEHNITRKDAALKAVGSTAI